MEFNYQARNKKGKVSSGIVDAPSQEAAISLLQRQGLYVTFLEEVGRLPFYARGIKLFEGVSRKDIVLFSRYLSIMFKAKVSLVEALQILANETKNPNFKEKLFSISEEIRAGTSFSIALSKYPKLFSPFYISMLKAGEASGRLSESLDHLAEHLRREYELTSKVKGAMVYPALILVFVFVVLLLMVFFIIPNLTQVLGEADQELPLITRIVLNFSDFFRRGFLIFALFFVSIFVFCFKYYKSEKGKRFFDELFLKIPLFGSFQKMVYLSRFAENLSTLISGGIPVSQSLKITGDIVGNSAYQEVIFNAREEVRKGQRISLVLSRHPDLFSPMFCQMVLVGEETGTLDKTLMDIVDFYQKETERNIESFLSILEPLLIIFLGGIVGTLMFAVLMPLYRLLSF